AAAVRLQRLAGAAWLARRGQHRTVVSAALRRPHRGGHPRDRHARHPVRRPPSADAAAMRLTCLVLLLACSMPAAAHGLFDGHLSERLPLLLAALLLGLFWVLYELGARRVRPRSLERICLHAAMLIAVFASFGPLDEWAETSSSWHMTQHMLFMLVIAPLWALARPFPQWRAVLGDLLRPIWQPLLRSARYPVALAMLHGSLIWIWHT